MCLPNRLVRSLAGLAAFAVLGLTGCDATDPSDGLIRSVSFEKDRPQVYDWSYVSLDSADTPIYQSQGRFGVRIAALHDRVGELTDLIRMESYVVEDEEKKHLTWYRQTRSELRDLAYNVTGEVPIVQPKRNAAPTQPLSPYGIPATASMLLRDRLEKAGRADSVQIRSDPRIVFVYPLKEGASWTSFTKPFLQTREVLGYRDVEVEAGTFRCAEIRVRIPELVPNMEWTDYVSEKGLVLRLVTHRNERRDAQNNPAGMSRSEERLELVSRGR